MFSKIQKIFANIFQSKNHSRKLYAIEEKINFEFLDFDNDDIITTIIFTTNNKKKAEKYLAEILQLKDSYKNCFELGRILHKKFTITTGYNLDSVNLEQAEYKFISQLSISDRKYYKIYKVLCDEDYDTDQPNPLENKIGKYNYKLIEIKNSKPDFEIEFDSTSSIKT